MNTSQNNSVQSSGQDTQPVTINNLHQAFADLAYSYGMLGRNISPERNNEALENIVIDCESLSDIAKALRLQAKGGAK